MRAQLHVRAGDPSQPSAAGLRVTRELLPSVPRKRPLTIAVMALAPQAGLTPTPWLLDGVLEACAEADRCPVKVITLGRRDAVELALAKISRDSRELLTRPSRDRRVPLRVGSGSRLFSIPRELIGSSMIVVAPLVLTAVDQGRKREWQGPVATSLAALARSFASTYARALGPGRGVGLRARADTREAMNFALGHRLARACFASASFVIDGTWSAPLDHDARSGAASLRALGRAASSSLLGAGSPDERVEPGLLGELVAPDRILGFAELARLELTALVGVDDWIGRRCGLSIPSEADTPELADVPGRWPELSLTVTRSQPKRLADRAISGIRSKRAQLLAGGKTQAALPARVPGRFAQVWTRRWYGERERGLRSRAVAR